MKKSSEIRQEFLNFFADKGHKIVPSAPVIPYNDPTLLFVNAGMNQFKDIFLGNAKPVNNRVANTQKCIRVSGKHNDLEEVGHDGYHHTFFEMLGNWSFGDYYKKEAIKWAWELLTEVWKLDKKRLWATYYEDDTDTRDLWQSETDIDPSHILKFGAKDNFWEMGETGPCGPCSEIHYDFTEKDCKKEDVNAGNPDVMEIWNLVFIQYNRDSNGKLHELPQKHVDTGMGFERIVSVLQNKKSNYETDIFLPLINELINITGKEYSGKYEAPMNVIADHVRTLTFAIGDGASPSKEKRGYVLRSILRRASFYGTKLDMHIPFIYKLVDVLTNTMGHVFPEIVEKKNFIKKVIKLEEENFIERLDNGLVIFNNEIQKMKKNNEKVLSGEMVFKLHDTYGFPVDLTQLIAREKGYKVDVKKFEELMDVQKERARKSRKLTAETGIFTITGGDVNLRYNYNKEYNPYDVDEEGIKTQIIHLHQIINTERSICILRRNPFYAESGGQVSDKGEILLPNGKSITVINSMRDYVIVQGVFDEAFLLTEVTAKIDYPRRQSIQRNHSATHLVHEALRRVLGPEIRQMGSYLDEKLLRFDFPHFHKLTDEEIKSIEEIVNKKILESIDVETKEIPIEDAKRLYPNLRMFFGDKYGDLVRVVIIDKDFSVELCGGTHVKNTKNIGFFKIIKEESIATGTRRITALTGKAVKEYEDSLVEDGRKKIAIITVNLDAIAEKNQLVVEQFKTKIELYSNELAIQKEKSDKIPFGDSIALATVIGATAATGENIAKVFASFNDEKKQLEKKLAKQKVQQAGGSIDELINKAVDVGGFKLVSGKVEADNADELKEIGDKLREKLPNGVGLLYSIIDNKVSLVAVVSDNLIKDKKLSAGKIAGDVAKILGGGGGGKPHLATAGGKDISKLEEAMSKLKSIVEGYIK